MKIVFKSGLNLILLSVTLCLLSCREFPLQSSKRDLNVLLITLDTTRADRLGFFGYPGSYTPNLDNIASRGVSFINTYSTSGMTAMAHASILTGLYPHKHGVRVFYGPTGNYLYESVRTLAGILGEAGYKTGGFVSAFTASKHYGLDKGFDTFQSNLEVDKMPDAPKKPYGKTNVFLREPYRREQRRGDAVTDEALEWVINVEAPYFLWVHYFDPHDPSLLPPDEAAGLFGVQAPQPGPGLMSPQSRLELYDPEIYYMDYQIGRLLNKLKAYGHLDDTVIAVLSDHGQGLMDHGWLQHRLLYQEQIKIPFMLIIPDLPSPHICPSIARNVDLMPTLLSILNIDIPEQIDGVDLIPLIRNQNNSDNYAYAEALNTLDNFLPQRLPDKHKDLLFCLVENDWKLIYHLMHPENSELYNLSLDPGEKNNLYFNHPEIAERLREKIEETGALEIETVQRDQGMNPNTFSALKSLGYIE